MGHFVFPVALDACKRCRGVEAQDERTIRGAKTQKVGGGPSSGADAKQTRLVCRTSQLRA